MSATDLSRGSTVPSAAGIVATLESVADPSKLWSAWIAIKSRRDPERASKEMTAFAEHEIDNVGQLSISVLSGAFDPGGTRVFTIPRENGLKPRTLEACPLRTRIVERSIATVVGPVVDGYLSPASFAYRSGLGVDDAIRVLTESRDRGAPYAVVADIQDCFNSIPLERLEPLLESVVPDRALMRLIRMLLHRERGGAAMRRSGLPQGAPTSPLWSNLYLDQLDRDLTIRGHSLVRYADDIVIPAESRQSAEAARDDLAAAVSELGLELNATKSDVMSFADGFNFVGTQITSDTPTTTARATTRGRKPLYVARSGARIAVRKGRILVENGDKNLLSVPQATVGQIVAFGPVGITAGTRQWALNAQIPITFLSARGRYLGAFDARGADRATRRMRQYRMADMGDFATSVVVRMVRGKLNNSRSLLQRYQSRSRSNVTGDSIGALYTAADMVSGKSSVAAARGVEGSAAAQYWKAFADLLGDTTEFPGRRRRPPTDAVNAALSLGYTLLTGEAVGAVEGAGLDSAVGFLHSERDGRASLALDLIEEFRAVVVDTVVLEMVHRRMLTGERALDGSFRLTKSSVAALFKRYEARMTTVTTVPVLEGRHSYRRALHTQAQLLAACIETGDGTGYLPITWRS